MRLSSSDLALIRDTQAHYTDLYLSIFQPNIVLQCQVNDATIAKGERSITYDSVSAGSWQNVKIGSTLLVGSSAGSRNFGKVRIKTITSSVITIAENSHIEWADNLYLTVLDYFDVWPIYPRIIQDPANSESTLWYKDYDIAYINQNTVLGCFMNIGPHRAVFADNGSAPLYFSASGSYPLSGSIAQVYWTFQSGTPATYTGMTPGYVDWGGARGHYLVSCAISGSNGWGEQGYRYVSVYDRPSQGTNIPTSKWQITSIQGSRAEGGYTATVEVFQNVTVHEGSIVVLFADEWYDGTYKSLGGNAPNASKIKFVGYVMDNSIEYNYKESKVTFEVASITDVMKELEGFAIELQSKASPSQWYQMADVNAKKAIYHYLKWHSNVISLCDIEYIGDDYLIQFFDSDRESLYDAIDNFMRGTYHGSVVSDKQGKMYLEVDAWIQSNATGTFSPLFVMSKYDWLNTPNIKEQRYPELSYLSYNGIAYSGVSTGTFKPLESEAPGSAPAYRGKSNQSPGFAVLGQAQLNELTGNEFFHENYQFPSIDTQMRGNWSNLDIAPQEAVQSRVDAASTVRGISITDLRMPSSIAWEINSEQKTFYPRVTWNAITTGPNAETVVIPDIVDDGGYGGVGGGRIPTITPPSLPTLTGVYGALKLETTGGVNKVLPQSTFVEVPLTYIEFSSEGLPAGTASGSWSGVNIIPTVGASGSYGVNYGFVSSLPGVYRCSYNIELEQLTPTAATDILIEAHITSNSASLGLLPDYTSLQFALGGAGLGSSIQGNAILLLPAGGVTTIKVIQYSTYTGLVIDRATASLEYLAYGS